MGWGGENGGKRGEMGGNGGKGRGRDPLLVRYGNRDIYYLYFIKRFFFFLTCRYLSVCMWFGLNKLP